MQLAQTRNPDINDFSSVNFDAGELVNSMFIVRTGSDSDYILESTVDARVIIDLLGCFRADSSGLRYFSRAPTRGFDSRTTGDHLEANEDQAIDALTASGNWALVNLAAINEAESMWLNVYEPGTPWPETAMLNARPLTYDQTWLLLRLVEATSLSDEAASRPSRDSLLISLDRSVTNHRGATALAIITIAVAGCGSGPGESSPTTTATPVSQPGTTPAVADVSATAEIISGSEPVIPIGSETACRGAVGQAAEGSDAERSEGFLDVAIVVCPDSSAVQRNLEIVGLETTIYDLDFLLIRCQQQLLIGPVCRELLEQED